MIDDAGLLQAVIDAYGRGAGTQSGDELKGFCPHCQEPTQGESQLNTSSGLFYCWGCTAKGNYRTLAKAFGLGNTHANTGAQRSRCTLAEYAQAKHLPADFLQGLGLADGKDEYGRAALVIPYYGPAGDRVATRYRSFMDKPKDRKDDRFLMRKGDKIAPYGRERLKDARAAGWLVVCEGESDAQTCWYAGVPALGIPGGGNWKAEWASMLDGLDVLVWQEPDDTGTKFAADVKASIPMARVIVAPPGLRDLSEAHCYGMNIPRLLEELKAGVPQKRLGSSWADLAGQIGPITWAWSRWLANGFLHELVGASGKGKSSLAMRIAACFLRGDDWPDGTPFEGETGEVLWVESEGGQVLNQDRAQKWCLPFERLRSPFEDAFTDASFDGDGHCAAIEATARADTVKLIVVDSLSVFCGGKRDENTAAMLEPLRWLAELARDTGKPVLVTHHLNKKGMRDDDTVDLDRVRGFSGITQLARLVWGLDNPRKDAPDALRLRVIKSNLGKFPSPLGLTIDDTGIVFGNAPEPEHKESDLERAQTWLVAQLASGAVKSTILLDNAASEGISERTLKRAKEAACVRSKRMGNEWLWTIPVVADDVGGVESVGTLGILDTLGTLGTLGTLDGGSGKDAKDAKDAKCANNVTPTPLGTLDGGSAAKAGVPELRDAILAALARSGERQGPASVARAVRAESGLVMRELRDLARSGAVNEFAGNMFALAPPASG